MIRLAPILTLLASVSILAQVAPSEIEKYPVFPECEPLPVDAIPDCFNETLASYFYSNFRMPGVVEKENYRGRLTVLLEVDKQGRFRFLYADAMYDELKQEVERVVQSMPVISPATYNGKPTYMQFTVPMNIPPDKPAVQEVEPVSTGQSLSVSEAGNEYDNLKLYPYDSEEYRSGINIPLSHHNYSLFDPALNRIGQNNHTAQKPYIYSEVNRYYDFTAQNQKILKDKRSWFGRKWWNEHMVTIKGDNYWITLDPGVDLQAGRDIGSDIETYNNTRLVYTQGGIGKNFNFFAVVYESQGRFADYFNRFAEARAPDGGNPAIIPARGIAKQFRSDSYDYPLATGHISWSPADWVNIQLGHGKNFIGDGYRSLFLSDNASPYPFVRINSSFWKIRYTNTWMSLRDVRSDVTLDGSFRTKYMANHYLSYNISKRLNIGLFEAVIWENDNDRGFDFNYVNPVIFYRAIEFSTGGRGGNALIGLSAKYKFSDRINAYGQLIIDEFSSSDIFGGEGSYKNKIGYQLGAKYYNAFGLENLYLQAEYNRIRPYTYSHNTVVLNYGHNNQAMAHTLGANFWEFIGIARYQNGRFFGSAKAIVAKRGFEFNTADDSFFYGGSVYGTEDDRVMDLGNELAQGNTTDFFHAELQAGYLINPATNLKIYASTIFRNFSPETNTMEVFDNQTTWLNFGIRTDLFNWYYDF